MTKKELIDYIASKTGIQRRDLIEKDVLLHRILASLTENKDFSKNYVFKGGTCLIKCYLGYYRFSEDLDFTWIHQKIFEKKSENQIRRDLSKEITTLSKVLETIAEKLELTFKADKQDSDFIEFGGNNKFVSFKLWYNSVELGAEQFIKIQINYVEKLMHAIKRGTAKNVLERMNVKEMSFLFPEDTDIIRNISL